jgi:hypothetical protein
MEAVVEALIGGELRDRSYFCENLILLVSAREASVMQENTSDKSLPEFFSNMVGCQENLESAILKLKIPEDIPQNPAEPTFATISPEHGINKKAVCICFSIRVIPLS